MELNRPSASTKLFSGSFGNTLFFLVISAAMHLDNVILGKFSYISGRDWLGWDTPLKLAFAANIEKSGTLAYWFPNILCGVDGTPSNQMFDLIFLPYLIAPHWAASFFVVTTISFVAMVAMYALLKDLAVDNIPAFLGALVFSLFSPVFPYIGLGLAGMPLIALVVRRTIERPLSVSSLVLWSATGSIISLASGFMLSFPYLLPLTALWVLALDPKRVARITAAFFVIALSGVIVRLPLLLSLIETSPESHRAEFDFAGLYGGPVWAYVHALYWWTLEFRNFAWAPLAAIIFFPRNRLLVTTVCIGLAVTVLAPSWDALRASGLGLGLLAGVNFRFHSSMSFFVAISVAVLLDAIAKRKMVLTFDARDEGLRTWPLAPICAFLISLIIVVHVAGLKSADIEGWLYGGSANAYLGQPAIAQLPRPDKDPYRVVTVQPKGGPETANFPAAYGLESADGYLNFYSKRYKQFWRAVIEPALIKDPDQQVWFDNFGHHAILEIPGVTPTVPVDFSEYFRKNLLSLANVRLVLSPVELTGGLPLEHKAEAFTKLHADLPARIMNRLSFSLHGQDINIYGNTDALPRFRLLGKARVYPSGDALLDDLRSATMETLASTAFLDGTDDVDVKDVTPGSGDVTLLDYRPDTFSLSTRTSSRQILVVSSNYYRAWQCRIDGIPVRVFPVYWTFWGAVVDQGAHDIVCSYVPLMKRLLGAVSRSSDEISRKSASSNDVFLDGSTAGALRR
jgi:hypothetical protein